MTVFPKSWHQQTKLITLGTFESVGRRTSQVSMGSHAGTHIDAPLHFIKNGESIDQIPLHRFLGKAHVYNVSHLSNQHEITLNEIQKLLQYAVVGQSIFFNFNWGHLFDKPEIYYKKQSWISEEAARFILSMKPPIIACDMAMLDNPSNGQGCDKDSPIHKIFLGHSTPLVENALFPQELSGDINYAVFPLKLFNLDGSPTRLVAWYDAN
jgi:arylformamidase